MKKASTFFLKATLLAMGGIVLALCVFALPGMWKDGSEEFPTASNAIFLIIVGLYMTAVPFFVALWQAFKLLRCIDRGLAFSDSSVKALRNIKLCAIVIAVIYVGGMPLLFPIADADDAPGAVAIGAVIACIPIVIAVFAAVLQKLFQNAIDIKSENDLTV